MKFNRTIKVTRIRRELLVPVPSPSLCPKCGCLLPAPLVPGMPLSAGPDVSSQIVPPPPEEKK
jgi:hypothetical protein